MEQRKPFASARGKLRGHVNDAESAEGHELRAKVPPEKHDGDQGSHRARYVKVSPAWCRGVAINSPIC